MSVSSAIAFANLPLRLSTILHPKYYPPPSPSLSLQNSQIFCPNFLSTLVKIAHTPTKYLPTIWRDPNSIAEKKDTTQNRTNKEPV
jgi:hypothetical protein